MPPSIRQHGRARFGIRQRHAHGHTGAGAVAIKPGFDVVLGRGVGQVHALDMHDLLDGTNSRNSPVM